MKVRCPECRCRGALAGELAGRMVRCARCGGKFLATEDSGGGVGVKWYYAVGDEKKGPISEAEFDGLVASGGIGSDTLVWCKGMVNWQTLAETQSEQAISLAYEESADLDETPAAVQSDAKPAADKPPVGARPGLIYAGGGKRFLAKIIDLVFMFALATLVEGLSRKLFPDSFDTVNNLNAVYLGTMLICLLAGMFYITWFVGKFGATPGKMVMNLKLVTPMGGKVSYGQAFGRYWAEFAVIWLTLLLGYLPVLFDAQKRGLHDRLSGTRVVAL